MTSLSLAAQIRLRQVLNTEVARPCPYMCVCFYFADCSASAKVSRYLSHLGGYQEAGNIWVGFFLVPMHRVAVTTQVTKRSLPCNLTKSPNIAQWPIHLGRGGGLFFLFLFWLGGGGQGNMMRGTRDVSHQRSPTMAWPIHAVRLYEKQLRSATCLLWSCITASVQRRMHAYCVLAGMRVYVNPHIYPRQRRSQLELLVPHPPRSFCRSLFRCGEEEKAQHRFRAAHTSS